MLIRRLFIILSLGLLVAAPASRGDQCTSELAGEPAAATEAAVFANTNDLSAPRVALVPVPTPLFERHRERTTGETVRRWLAFPGPVDLALLSLATTLAYVEPDQSQPAVIGLVFIVAYRGLTKAVSHFAASTSASAGAAAEAEIIDEPVVGTESLDETVVRLRAAHPALPLVAFVSRDDVRTSTRQLARRGYVPAPADRPDLRLAPSLRRLELASSWRPDGGTARALAWPAPPPADEPAVEAGAPLALTYRSVLSLAESQNTETMLRLAAPATAVTVEPTPSPSDHDAPEAIPDLAAWPSLAPTAPTLADEPEVTSMRDRPEQPGPARLLKWAWRAGRTLPRAHVAPAVAAFFGAMVGTFFGHGSTPSQGGPPPARIAAHAEVRPTARPWTGIASTPTPPPPESASETRDEPTRFALSLPALPKPKAEPRVDEIRPGRAKVKSKTRARVVRKAAHALKTHSRAAAHLVKRIGHRVRTKVKGHRPAR